MASDREKLVKLLDEAHDNYYKSFDPNRDFYGGVADHLIANGVTFATDTNVGSKWISVKDRLPETHLRCLVYREGYNKMGGYLTMATFTPCYKGLEGDLMDGRQVWYDYDSECGDYELTNVTHWIPLPDPPNED
jgi:hypothetical protein